MDANGTMPVVERPSLLSVKPKNVHPELQRLRQWVVWLLEERDGKWTKVPYSPLSRQPAATNDARTWATFDTAVEAVEDFDGVGFVFSKDDPFVGIDIDKCRDRETGVLTDRAQRIIASFPTYCEVSPSGTGVHLICKGTLPTETTGKRRDGVEVYQHGRFFCVTGHVIPAGGAQ